MALIDDSRNLPGMTGEARVEDYLALLKPSVMQLVVFTAIVGLIVAPGGVNPFIGIIAVACIAIGAGASGALNMWYDADIDAIMSRTQNRPIPAGRISKEEALVFGLVLSVFSVALLGLAANWVAAALLAASARKKPWSSVLCCRSSPWPCWAWRPTGSRLPFWPSPSSSTPSSIRCGSSARRRRISLSAAPQAPSRRLSAGLR